MKSGTQRHLLSVLVQPVFVIGGRNKTIGTSRHRTAVMDAPTSRWRSLDTPQPELCLHNTLPTGQSFRWRRTSAETYTGVIGQRVVQLRQLDHDVHWTVVARGPLAPEQEDAAVIQDYFNLNTQLASLCDYWSSRDERFRRVLPFLPGARMLRQDPVECLFQFICSSNNHISRIHGMVERLCSTYGSELLCSSEPDSNCPATQQQQQDDLGGALDQMPQRDNQQERQLAYYAFPTLEQLSAATEEALRADGFGYRAKFIVGSVQQLLAKPEGGAAWLLGLRAKPYAEAHEALCTLPGIGPKVAACICLFSLDKHDATPVDTHVWNLATRYYAPHLANKTLNKKLHDTIQQVFVDRFGPYAGWAHNTLFISELASHKPLLPATLASPGRTAASSSKKRRSPSKSSAEGVSSSDQEAVLAAAASAASAIQEAAAAEVVEDIVKAGADQSGLPKGVQPQQGSRADDLKQSHDVAVKTVGSTHELQSTAAVRSSGRRRRRTQRYVSDLADADIVASS